MFRASRVEAWNELGEEVELEHCCHATSRLQKSLIACTLGWFRHFAPETESVFSCQNPVTNETLTSIFFHVAWHVGLKHPDLQSHSLVAAQALPATATDGFSSDASSCSTHEHNCTYSRLLSKILGYQCL